MLGLPLSFLFDLAMQVMRMLCSTSLCMLCCCAVPELGLPSVAVQSGPARPAGAQDPGPGLYRHSSLCRPVVLQVREAGAVPAAQRKLLCTARPNWLSLSTTFFNKAACHRVPVPLYDVSRKPFGETCLSHCTAGALTGRGRAKSASGADGDGGADHALSRTAGVHTGCYTRPVAQSWSLT